MKTKLSKPLNILILILTTILLCFGIYYFVDNILNGTFVKWFMSNYMITHEVFSNEIQKSILVTEPNWSQLKNLLLILFIILGFVILVTIMIVSHFYSKSKVRQSITATSQILHSYITDKQDCTDIFPKEYAEITAEIVEIKSIMQRHEQILQNEAARKNDLIAYLAHDLKTPLTSVIGYLALLNEASDMPDQQKNKYVKIALDKANRLEKLINEFFEITRYNLQQIELEEETIDLYYMLVQMTDEFYPLLNAHANTVELQIDENMTIYGDSAKLARVFNNILKNAITYSYPNTAIKISEKILENEIQIYFCNKGKTIPEQKLNSIFEKFFRLDEARTTNTGGAGLGLAIAKEIISLHGGVITATSKDELTTFSISLPLRHS